VKLCSWHECNNSLTGKQKNFCSQQCKNKYYVAKRRKQLKQNAVNYKGDKCMICGYDRCIEALVFHHIDENKGFGIASRGYTRSWFSVKEELDKCIMVCANCHAEIHAGLHDVAALISNG
jgi:hypothetical protein